MFGPMYLTKARTEEHGSGVLGGELSDLFAQLRGCRRLSMVRKVGRSEGNLERVSVCIAIQRLENVDMNPFEGLGRMVLIAGS